jgi:hypothetical protein
LLVLFCFPNFVLLFIEMKDYIEQSLFVLEM